MSTLLVRGVNDTIVTLLKKRAAANGRSAEAEHREILVNSLAKPRRKSFAEALAQIPGVGKDSDFERSTSSGRG